MNEIISSIAISVIFLAGLIPLILGIIDYAKENKRQDEERKSAEKSASHQ